MSGQLEAKVSGMNTWVGQCPIHSLLMEYHAVCVLLVMQRILEHRVRRIFQPNTEYCGTSGTTQKWHAERN